MSDCEATRTELLAALSDLSRMRPEWRLGQLVANIATTAGRLDPGGVWDIEDDEALAAAKTLVEQYHGSGNVVAAADGAGLDRD